MLLTCLKHIPQGTVFRSQGDIGCSEPRNPYNSQSLPSFSANGWGRDAAFGQSSGADHRNPPQPSQRQSLFNRVLGFQSRPSAPLVAATAFRRGRENVPNARSERLEGTQLPAHDHIRFDDFSGVFQIGPGFVHIESDGVEFVAGGLGEAITGRRARVKQLRDS